MEVKGKKAQKLAEVCAGEILLNWEDGDARQILIQVMCDEAFRLKKESDRKERDSIRRFLTESYRVLFGCKGAALDVFPRDGIVFVIEGVADAAFAGVVQCPVFPQQVGFVGGQVGFGIKCDCNVMASVAAL